MSDPAHKDDKAAGKDEKKKSTDKALFNTAALEDALDKLDSIIDTGDA